MNAFDDFSFSAEDFSGTVRLFPLPNLVLFPHIVQPIHIFEPRYRSLLERALDDDRLIAMATLKPGWEPQYEAAPPIDSAACLCRVLLHREVEDGRYNVLLLGLRRLQLVEELPQTELFREATATIRNDVDPAESSVPTEQVREKLHSRLIRILATLPDADDHLDQLFGGSLSLGKLTDVLAYMLDLEVAAKLQLLAEPDVWRRTDLLLDHLEEPADSDEDDQTGGPGFLPPFSAN